MTVLPDSTALAAPALEDVEAMTRRGLLRTAVGVGLGAGLVSVVGLPAGIADALSPTGEVYRLVNQHRAAAGRRPLALHVNLTKAAIAHSTDMARHRRLSHTGSDGSTVGTRILRAGYRWGACAENIAYGQPTGAAVMRSWMNSAPHRANILSSNYIQLGISYVRASNGLLYWTMTLARGMR